MKLRNVVVPLCLFAALITGARAQSVSNPRTITVSPDGSGAAYSSLSSALGAISDASASNQYVILVYPGIYTGSNNVGLRWKSYVSLRGVDRNATIIRGSTSGNTVIPLIDASMLQGIEISNITLDGSAQVAEFGYEQNGSTNVCGATIVFNNVNYVSGDTGSFPGVCISSDPEAFIGEDCDQPGDVTVRNSDTGIIADFGGNWLIANSRVHASGGASGEAVVAYIRTGSGGSTFAGGTTIVGSTLEATGTGASMDSVTALYVAASLSTGPIRVTGSSLTARSTSSSGSGSTRVVYPGGAADSVLIEGSTLVYQSVSGASGGLFYGVFTGAGTDAAVDVRGSIIRSVGSGGTRADVVHDSNGAAVTLAGVDYSTVAGNATADIATSDFRQATFSSDLTIPLAAPSAAANGKLYINGSNQLCWRSGGAARCITGS